MFVIDLKRIQFFRPKDLQNKNDEMKAIKENKTGKNCTEER